MVLTGLGALLTFDSGRHIRQKEVAQLAFYAPQLAAKPHGIWWPAESVPRRIGCSYLRSRGRRITIQFEPAQIQSSGAVTALPHPRTITAVGARRALEMSLRKTLSAPLREGD